MSVKEKLKMLGWSQKKLAQAIAAGDLVENKHEIKAHRVANGSLPTKQEAYNIFVGSKGKINGNTFFELPKSWKKK